MFAWLKRRRRAELRQSPVPPAWVPIVDKNVRYTALLSPEDRAELMGHVHVFLAEKHFEGCAGLVITDEVRVTIATQACILLLHRETDYFAKLLSILVYPSTYQVPAGRHVSCGMIAADPEARLGESWVAGVVVLVWDSVLAGSRDIHDASNVVLHEFAHQLDQEDGVGDGAPVLPQRSMYAPWARVLGHDFDQLVQDTEHRHRSLIDAYGATNAAEFFAVVTETFFEKPLQLRKRHAELYAQLQGFYRQDPASLVERQSANE